MFTLYTRKEGIKETSFNYDQARNAALQFFKTNPDAVKLVHLVTAKKAHMFSVYDRPGKLLYCLKQIS